MVFTVKKMAVAAAATMMTTETNFMSAVQMVEVVVVDKMCWTRHLELAVAVTRMLV